MKKNKIILFIIITVFTSLIPVRGEGQGSLFVFSQLKFPGNWDPYSGVFNQIHHYLVNTTSLRVKKERRIVSLKDEMLFYSPFLVLTGRGHYPAFSEEEILNLRRYIQGGGLLLVDTAGDDSFSASVSRTLERAFPRKSFSRIPDDHAVFRSFYLVEYVSGLNIKKPYLEAMEVDGRYAVIKSENDIFGIWERDRMGNFLNKPSPGKPGQRKEAIKLSLNIAVFSLTGTYKNDPVHQPDIKRKMGR
ncbi:MAG: DUF4159 domain-containing protein [Elusimicrobiota bacterium]